MQKLPRAGVVLCIVLLAHTLGIVPLFSLFLCGFFSRKRHRLSRYSSAYCDFRAMSINTSSETPQRTLVDGNVSAQSPSLAANRPDRDVHLVESCGANGRVYGVDAFRLRPPRSVFTDERQPERLGMYVVGSLRLRQTENLNCPSTM